MKSDYIRFRLTSQEKVLLQEKAKKVGMSMTDYFKFCCLINPPKIEPLKK